MLPLIILVLKRKITFQNTSEYVPFKNPQWELPITKKTQKRLSDPHRKMKEKGMILCILPNSDEGRVWIYTVKSSITKAAAAAAARCRDRRRSSVTGGGGSGAHGPAAVVQGTGEFLKKTFRDIKAL